MRKRSLSFNYSTLWRICQGLSVAVCVLGTFLVLPVAVATGESTPTEVKVLIKNNCVKIKDTLSDLQHRDSRARVYFGRQYETLLSKFITPLNLRLVENNLSDSKLLENQTNFANRRTSFVNDYIKYQQSLEELVQFDCRAEPDKFYEKLVLVRERRARVENDVTKLRALAGTQKTLVESLRQTLGEKR